MYPLTQGFFSVVNTTVLHDLQLVESVEERLVQRAGYKLYTDFSSVQRVGAPNPRVQGSPVVCSH